MSSTSSLTAPLPPNAPADAWVLLESGQAHRLKTKYFPPPPSDPKLIDAYFIGEHGADLSHAARIAAHVAYIALQQRGVNLGRYKIAFHIEALPPSCVISGGSMGLALALACARKLHPDGGGAFAATGEILSIEEADDGKVGGIKGLVSKMQGVLERMQAGDRFFYPRVNDAEIPDSLRREFVAKGVRCWSVDTVAEALERLYPAATPLKPVTPPFQGTVRLWMLLLVLTLLVGGVFTGDYWFPDLEQVTVPTVSPAPAKPQANKIPAAPPSTLVTPLVATPAKAIAGQGERFALLLGDALNTALSGQLPPGQATIYLRTEQITVTTANDRMQGNWKIRLERASLANGELASSTALAIEVTAPGWPSETWIPLAVEQVCAQMKTAGWLSGEPPEAGKAVTPTSPAEPTPGGPVKSDEELLQETKGFIR